MSFFFPFRPAAKPGFSLPFSLFFSLPLFVSRSVSRVAFPSLFSGKAGGPSIPTLGQQTSSFYLVLLSNMPPPKTVFSALFFFLFLSFFTLHLVSYSLRFPYRKGPERPGPCVTIYIPQKPCLYISYFFPMSHHKKASGEE